MALAHRPQSATPPVGRDGRMFTRGLVRGVVVAVYVSDSDSPFDLIESPIPLGGYIVADVLTYSSRGGTRSTVLRNCLVGDAAGVHEGRIRKPRAATRTFSGAEIGVTTDPLDLDGDHVVVDFIDGEVDAPIIMQTIPHPRRDAGASTQELGHRSILKLEDGNPDLWKNRGTFYGIDDKGNFLVDTRSANGGAVDDEGKETPADSALFGNVVVNAGTANTITITLMARDGTNKKLQITMKDNEVDVRLQDGATLKLSGKDAATVATIGDGVRSVAIFEQLEAFMAQVSTWAATHTHPDGFGSTAPTVVPFPTFDPLIKSTHLKLPAA